MKKVQIKIMNVASLIVFIASIILLTTHKSEGADAKILFESKCSVCHSIERPKSKKKSSDDWKSTVMRMKTVNGCQINDEEAGIIIKYLTDNYGL